MTETLPKGTCYIHVIERCTLLIDKICATLSYGEFRLLNLSTLNLLLIYFLEETKIEYINNNGDVSETQGILKRTFKK